MTSDRTATADRTAIDPSATASAGPEPVAQTFEFEPHNCFACGSLNEGGLQLDLHLGSRRSWTELTLDRRFEGWVGIVHGGILATILDEVMAWALVAEENWGVTARMTIDYRRPVTIGTPIRGEGWIVRSRRRLVDTAGRIVDVDGNVLASAKAVYVAADEARKRELRARYGYRVRAARADADPGAGGDPGADVGRRTPLSTEVATPGAVDDEGGPG